MKLQTTFSTSAGVFHCSMTQLSTWHKDWDINKGVVSGASGTNIFQS